MIDYNKTKFIIIVCCFINTLLTRQVALHKTDINLLRLGMFFTMLADYFLILTTQYIIGLISFCIVQIIYNLRYMGKERLRVQLISSLIAFITIYFIFNIELIISLGLVYCVLFINSFISLFLGCKKYPIPNNIFILLGMILFALCDINVALYGLSLYASRTVFYSQYLDTIFFLIWIFYIPSQVLLSLSGKKYFISSYKFQK